MSEYEMPHATNETDIINKNLGKIVGSNIADSHIAIIQYNHYSHNWKNFHVSHPLMAQVQSLWFVQRYFTVNLLQ